MRATLRLVWGTGVRHLIAHRTRLALSAFGVAAGVALAVAVSSLGSSINASLRAVASAAASEANLEIRPNTDTGLRPELLAEVRAVPGVEAAGATVESYTRVRSGDTDERVFLLGVDRGILELAPEAAETSQLTNPLGLLVAASVADRLGVEGGDRIDVATPQGWHAAPVGGVVRGESADRGRIVIGAIGVVQGLLDRPGTLDAIYVKASDPERTVAALQRVVGDAGRAGPVALRGERISQLIEGATASFAAASIVALIVGAFLVYNTMAMAAIERIQEAAIMRAVGARRRQIFALFLTEGGLLGLCGSAAGVGGGVLLARALLGQRGGPLGEVYPIDVTRVSIEPGQLVVAAVAGVVASLAAAWLPARRISRVDVAPALGPMGTLEDPTAPAGRATTIAGLVLIGIGSPVAVFGFLQGRASGTTLVGFTAAISGVALLIRTGLPSAARLLFAPFLRPKARTSGMMRLALGEVLRSPGRTAFTAGAVLLALSLVVAFTILQSSFLRTFELRFEDILSADLYVRSVTWRPLGSDVPLHEDLAADIQDVPGVSVAYPFRITTAALADGRAILVLAYDFASYSRLPGLPPEQREVVREQAEALRGSDTILASPSVLSQFGYEVGDTVELATPTGIRRLRIAGTIDDPSAVTPEVFLDYPAFRRLWGSGGADSIPVGVRPGADPEQVRAEILKRFGDRYGLAVDTGEQYRDRINSAVRGTLNLLSSVQLVAVIVAALGLANTLLISTFERRRDLGVLRAVGMLRRQVRRMVVLEALAIGCLGVVMAWGVGTLIGLAMREVTAAQVGLEIGLVLPLWGYAAAAGIGIVASVGAALYPAIRASRVDVVDALQYE